MRPVEAASPVGEPETPQGDRSRWRKRRVLLIVAVAVVAVLALGFWWLLPAGPPPLTPADVDKAVQRGLQQAQEQQRNAPPDATIADRAITPSLVTVTAQRGRCAGNIDTRLGSGVVINAAGAVLTALHVVDGATRIQIAFADGTTAGATVLVSQPDSDIAVLAPDRLPDLVVPAVMAGPPPVGDAVYAVGNPLGLTHSLTAGVVSATDRSIPTGRGHAVRAHPVRRRRQPGQQRRAAAQPGRAGGRHRHRPGQPGQAGLLRRDRVRRADRHRGWRGGRTAAVTALSRRTMEHELPLEPTLYQVKKTIVGQDGLLERMLVALLARGHLLVEGVPGLAKTMAVKTLAQTIGGEFQRIQFTSDLVPADVVGTRIYNQRDGEFQVSFGPVFANLLLADEINRAPAKVQSALLEVMQERQVTIGRETYPAPDPFLVMATQNPIESEGTYPLPEAQLDRFMFKVLVGYPTATQEYVVVERMISTPERPEAVIDTATLREFQRATDDVYVDPQIIEYAVKIAAATRDLAGAGHPELARYVSFGASPRASINMVLGAKALAFLRGRDYALPADVQELAKDVLRHRLVLSYEALADDVSPDALLDPLLDSIALPQVEPGVRAHKS